MPTYNNARECLAAIASRYATLKSYADEGFVRRAGSAGPNSCWFETQFSRPSSFRFQFARPHPYPPLRHIVTKTVIGSDGITSYFCTKYPNTDPTTEIEESLAMAIAGATGISQGTAHTIGSLLVDSVGGFSLSTLKRPRFRRSREFDGQHCCRISGRHPRGGRVTIWFGSTDLLLRKVVRHWAKREEVRNNIQTQLTFDNDRFDVPCV